MRFEIKVIIVLATMLAVVIGTVLGGVVSKYVLEGGQARGTTYVELPQVELPQVELPQVELPQFVAASGAASGECREVATEAQARALIGLLLDEPEILSTSPVKTGNTSCLLEVEMLAERGNKHTKGFVYVLPDGESMLNGPLLDKRSMLQIVQMAAGGSMGGMMSSDEISDFRRMYESGIDPREAAKAHVMKSAKAERGEDGAGAAAMERLLGQREGETANQVLLSEFKAAPIIHYNFTDNPRADVYVVYDSQCSACKGQFKGMEEAAERHGLNFHWIPAYLNNNSWLMAAQTIKELEQGNEYGQRSMLETFSKSADPEALRAAMKTLTQEHYDKAKIATEIIYTINRASSSPIGTPLLFVENTQTGGVQSAFGFISEAKDWELLINPN